MTTNIKKLKKGSLISESSHYVITDKVPGAFMCTHLESGEEVKIGSSYIAKFTHSADLYDKEVEVTKEDKRDGTPGIRTIFEGIHSSQVFTVCFTKQNKPKTDKKLQAEVDAVVAQFSDSIESVKANKKGVADAAKKLVLKLMLNPILPFEEGEDRILRGYKVQFTSRDGRYNCVDIDIPKAEKEIGIRPVNLNTIKWIIFGGVKYVVK